MGAEGGGGWADLPGDRDEVMATAECPDVGGTTESGQGVDEVVVRCSSDLTRGS